MTWLRVSDIPQLREKVGIENKRGDDFLTTLSWINLETGAKVHIVNAGGWRHPEDSSIRVFHESPAESVVDITTWFGDTSYDKDPEKTGPEAYDEVFQRVIKEVERLTL